MLWKKLKPFKVFWYLCTKRLYDCKERILSLQKETSINYLEKIVTYKKGTLNEPYSPIL